MGSFRIVTESTADLTPEIINSFDVTVIPMHFSVDGVDYANYPDNRELAPGDFFDMLKNGKQSTTMAVNIGDFESTFTPILEEGCDILYLAFSSALSSTYDTSLLAISELKERFPKRKIISVNTLCASMGEGLITCLAAKKRDEGMNIEEVAQWVTDNRLSLCQWFTVDDLMHLYRGGRVSAISAHIGSMLGIKPVLHVDDEGRLIPVLKVRGRRQSLEALGKSMQELSIDPAEQMVLISHGDCLESAEFLAAYIRENMGTQDIRIGPIGPVVGSHSGPGTVALFFVGTHR